MRNGKRLHKVKPVRAVQQLSASFPCFIAALTWAAISCGVAW
jgi:hypothetical protein